MLLRPCPIPKEKFFKWEKPVDFIIPPLFAFHAKSAIVPQVSKVSVQSIEAVKVDQLVAGRDAKRCQSKRGSLMD